MLVPQLIIASLMNIVVPGTGLIVLGRAWLGFAVALWFGLAAEIAICGKLVAPATTPWAVTATAAGVAGFGWLAGQGLLVARIRARGGRHPVLPAAAPDAAD
jgi:hypothetical protein